MAAAAATKPKAPVAAQALVKRYSRIDGPRPAIHAPHKVMDLVVSVLLEESRHLEAAASMVADGHDVLRPVELVQAAGHFAHRHEPGAGNARALVFPGLAHIEQHGLRAARVGEPGGELGGCDLLHAARS